MATDIEELREDIKKNGIVFVDTNQSIGKEVADLRAKLGGSLRLLNTDEGRELAAKYSSQHPVSANPSVVNCPNSQLDSSRTTQIFRRAC